MSSMTLITPPQNKMNENLKEKENHGCGSVPQWVTWFIPYFMHLHLKVFIVMSHCSGLRLLTPGFCYTIDSGFSLVLLLNILLLPCHGDPLVLIHWIFRISIITSARITFLGWLIHVPTTESALLWCQGKVQGLFSHSHDPGPTI